MSSLALGHDWIEVSWGFNQVLQSVDMSSPWSRVGDEHCAIRTWTPNCFEFGCAAVFHRSVQSGRDLQQHVNLS